MTTSVNTYQPGLVLQRLVPLSGVFPSDLADAGPLPMGCVRSFGFNFGMAQAASAQGQVLSISGNTALFSIIGNAFGGDVDVLTFALPDFDSRAAVGIGAGPGLGAVAMGQQTGAAEATVTQANLPASLGGSSQPFNEDQPALGVRHLIRVEGVFSWPDSGGALNSIGMVVPWLGQITPGGFVECDGRLLNIDDYEALFQIIGTTFGGDGESTFAVPDLRGRTIIGQGNGISVGEMGGQGDVFLGQQNLPVDMGGGGQPSSNADPSLALTFIIALQGIFPNRDGGVSTGSEPMLGEVMAFTGSYAPRGWALCQGQLLSIAQNQALFSLLGTQFGGDGRVTFALPDLRGRDVLGTGDLPVGSVIGSETFGLGLDQAPGLAYSGSAAGDMLYGANQGDVIDGLGGNDQIRGWGGIDRLIGGSGRDFLAGGDGNDRLTGGAEKDRLYGNSGADRLTGGGGLDQLWGGGNSDRFVFLAANSGNDFINDFSSAQGDKLVIDASGFGGGLAEGALAATRLVVDGAANRAIGQFLYDSATGQLSWDADGKGLGAAVNVAHVLIGGIPVAGLAVSDFEIVA